MIEPEKKTYDVHITATIKVGGVVSQAKAIQTVLDIFENFFDGATGLVLTAQLEDEDYEKNNESIGG